MAKDDFRFVICVGIPLVGVPRVGVPQEGDPKVVGGVLLFSLSSFKFSTSREFLSRTAGFTEIYSQYFKIIFGTQILLNSLAPFELRIQYEYAQPQFEDGARDVNNIWVPVIMRDPPRHCLTKFDCYFSHGLSFNNFINQASGFQTSKKDSWEFSDLQ